MTDCTFEKSVKFVFEVDLADSIGRRAEAECTEMLVTGYTYAKEIEVEHEQVEMDSRIMVLIPPDEIDAFDTFMLEVGIEPTRVYCSNTEDAYKAEKCGWTSIIG
jgi:hypothetical protein